MPATTTRPAALKPKIKWPLATTPSIRVEDVRTVKIEIKISIKARIKWIKIERLEGGRREDKEIMHLVKMLVLSFEGLKYEEIGNN